MPGKSVSAVGSDSSSDKLMMGTRNEAVNLDFFSKAVLAFLPKSKLDEDSVYTMKVMFEELKPASLVEAMVYAQLLALHTHSMDLMAEAHRSVMIETKEKYLSVSNKLIRTFNAALGALERFKRQGRQIIRVETVNVNEGGQAIVGNLEQVNGRGVIDYEKERNECEA
jgi:hypothetical protein